MDPRVYEALGVVLDRILGDELEDLQEAEVVDGDDDDEAI